MEATMEAETQIKVPATHYSKDENEALFFYGGPFSNFVTEMGGQFGDKRLFIVAGHEWLRPPGGPKAFRERVTFGADYRTVEHFFQASKAINYDDHEWVRDAWAPKEAKHRGRSIPIRLDWEQVKLSVMMTGLRVKFESGSFMANLLLGTGDRYIAEDSPYDDVWGIRDADGGLTGKNLLGRCLMSIRQELRDRLVLEQQASEALAEIQALGAEAQKIAEALDATAD